MSPTGRKLENPYDWRRHRPRVEVARSGVETAAQDLAQGGSGVLLAGRGMGKSVFLRQLHAELERTEGVLSLLFSAPPAELTAAACIEALARRLGVEVTDPLDTREVIEAHLARSDAPPKLVLLYDEFDRYARGTSPPASPPGKDFFNNLESTRRDFPELGVLAAGSIGVFVFRDALGSSFLARASRLRLAPFEAEEVARLARPFSERGDALGEEVLEALGLATGGNPALVTFGLESLWSRDRPGLEDVVETFAGFRTRHGEFLRDFQLSFSAPELSEAPQRVWELIQSTDGPISQAALARACVSPNGILRLDAGDVLDLLQAAGLAEVRGSARADPVTVRPIASILSLPMASSGEGGLRQRLRADLRSLLARMHASSADFFRPGRSDGGKRLVPEAVFAAYLALGLGLLGWQVERETQQGAGRSDLQLRWNGSEDSVLIEVKLWGRSGYRESHRQLAGYWSTEVAAGAVVMITDAALPDWPESYRRDCLEAGGVEIEETLLEVAPLRALFRTTSTTADGLAATVDHFLLSLACGR